MEQGIYLVTLIGTALVLLAAFSSLVAFRFGAPLLLVFLGIGLAVGVDGLGLSFDNAGAAYFIGSLALAVILFDSGFGTRLSAFRTAALPASALATLGVVLTTLLMGVICYLVTDFGWLESFLLGACVASTDAAAVFFLLRAGNLSLRERVRSTLEVESSANDPIAIFLTLTLVGAIAMGTQPDAQMLLVDIVIGFVSHMTIGLVAGLAGGYLIVPLVQRLKLDPGLIPIFILALSLMLYAATGAIGGSGFLAVYVAGLVAGNSRMRGAANVKRFQDGLSWLAQIIMFLVLGLFATPSGFPAIFIPALLCGLGLIFIARPIAVAICLLPFRFSRPEASFISWVGLRGAVSILLALTPIIEDIDNATTIFNMVFIIVLVSLIVQGWTLGPLAHRLGLVLPPRIGPLNKVELELPGSAHHELLAYRVVAGSPVARGERIPRWARPSLVVRDGRSMSYQYAGRLVTDDYVYIFVPDRYPRLLDRLFASKAAVDPNDGDFFGDFDVDPARPARELEAAYGVGLQERERGFTIAELIVDRLGGRAEYGDRVLIGPIDLIVRDVDDDGHVSAVGLSLEHGGPAARVPVFLSPGEIADRLAGLFRRRNEAPPKKADSGDEPG